MAHFAKIDKSGFPFLVTKVIVAEQDFIDTQEGTWVQTSYNTDAGIHKLGGTPLRKNYAGIRFIYDEVKDAFYSQQPFRSWTLNESTCRWESPVAHPYDNGGYETGIFYQWDESVYQGDNSKGWVPILKE